MTKRIILAFAALAFTAGSADAFVLLGDKWMDPSMPVPYRLSTEDETCITGDDELDELRAAFQVWEDVAGARLTFQDTGLTGACGFATDGFNTMSMDDCNGQIPSGVIAATSLLNWGGPLNGSSQGGDPTWIGVETGAPDQEVLGLTESDIVFSGVLRFGTFADISSGCMTDNCGSGGAFDVRGIMVHESGHLIGLGHSAVPAATMRSAVGACDASLTTLDPDDIQGCIRLYDDQYQAFEVGTVSNPNLRTSLMNAGDLGVSGSGSAVPGQFGAGFEYPPGRQNLYEAGLILGTGANDPVSSDYRQPGTIGQDNDFYQTTGVSFQNTANGQLVQAAFSDEVVADGYDVRVVATMHAFDAAPDDEYSIICYKVTNGSAGTISGLRVGLAMDWDFNDVFASNSSVWDGVNQVGMISDPSTPARIGLASLNVEGTATYRSFTSADPNDEASKAGYLFDGFASTDVLNSDVNVIIATGDFTLQPGESAIASFAIVAGSTEANMLTNLAAARAAYDEAALCDVNIVAVETASAPNLPMTLGQNVPNPFNPTTRIAYDIERGGQVKLRIYDAAGRAIRTLIDGIAPAGSYEVSWDGTDDAGQSVPSGLYFYRLDSAEGSVSRKMMLLK